jgi:hypothetical protein
MIFHASSRRHTPEAMVRLPGEADRSAGNAERLVRREPVLERR